MKKNTIFRLLLAFLLIIPLFVSCERIDLRAFAAGIPLKEDITWGSFKTVLNLGAEGSWDTNRLGDVSIILDGDEYKMWYDGYDGSVYRIIYAESADGKIWSNFQLAVETGNVPGTDDNSARFSTVLKFGQTNKMWYSGSNSGQMLIIYCDSWDGVNWNSFEVVVSPGDFGDVDGGMAWSPSVILDDGKYKMWYSGQVADGEYFKISTIYCDSEDGINWKNFKVMVQAGAEGISDSRFVTGPVVVNNNGKGLMWYRGSNVDYESTIIYCETQ